MSLSNVEYLISFSSADKNKFKNCIMAINHDGTHQEYKLNSSMAIENAIKYNNEYRFYSRQSDIHYKISSTTVDVFNLLETEMAGGFYGVFSANENDGTILQTVNCGTTDQGYLMKLVVSVSETKEYDFYNKILCNAVQKDENTILSYIDLNSNFKDENSIGISKIAVFDNNKAKIISEIELPVKFRAEPDAEILNIDDSILIFSNKLDEQGKFDSESYLGMYSITENKLIDIVTLENVQILQIYKYDSKIFIVDIYGDIFVYDKALNKIDFYELNLGDVTIRKIQQHGQMLYYALIDQNSDIYIHSYDLVSNKKIDSIFIPRPASIIWGNENFDFLPVIQSIS